MTQSYDADVLTTDEGVAEIYRRARNIARLMFHVPPGDQDDAIADAVCAVLAARNQYDPARGPVWAFAHWQMVGAVSLAISRWKRRNHRESVRLDAPGGDRLSRNSRDFTDDVADRVLVEQMLSDILPRYRDLIVRTYFRDETDEQIGAALGYRSVRGVRYFALACMAQTSASAA